MSTDILVASEHDGLLLKGFHWAAPKPIAVMSLVHGFGEHSGRYHDMASHLNAAGISVVALDLRGHGRTESPRGVCKNYSEMVHDVRSLLAESKRLYPNLPHYLFGHSMGGGLVLHMGLTEKQSLAGYLVSAPLIIPKEPVPKTLRVLARIMSKIMPKGTMPNTIRGDQVTTIQTEQDAYESDPLNHDRLGFGLAMGMLSAGEDVYAESQDWDKPLCLWHAYGDQLTDFEASKNFAEEAENCSFTAFENVEHEMHNDTCREAVYALMTNFMKAKIT